MRSARLDEAALAIGFLTRLPVGGNLRRVPSLGDSVWAFPLAGFLAALPGALVLMLWPGLLGAILAVGATIWITGGLHEDGLADLVDGLGGRDRAHSLRIMRDSNIGSYGVLALGLGTALRVATLAMLPGAPAAMLVSAMMSRAGMGAVLRMKPARSDGLGAGAGRPRGTMILIGMLIAVAVGLFLLGPVRLLVLGAAMTVAQVALVQNTQRRLGGQTGDSIGAAQQVGEIAGLTALALVFG